MSRKQASRRGNVVVATLVVLALLLGLSAAFLSVSTMNSKTIVFNEERETALEITESAIADAFYTLKEDGFGEDMEGERSGSINGGSYLVTISRIEGDDSNRLRKIVAVGTLGETTRKVEAIAKTGLAHEVFYHALYAGNVSEDPSYAMRFGGGGETDGDPVWVRTIHYSRWRGWRSTWELQNLIPQTDPDIIGNGGDVHSNGDIVLEGNAVVEGVMSATGDIYLPDTDDAAGGGNVRIDPPNWENIYPENLAEEHADLLIDVAAHFAEGTTTLPNTGIESGMNPTVTTVDSESDPAHIFALGVSDDLGAAGATDNPNYFLGDWYERTGGYSSRQNGETITIDAAGNEMVYFVEGNVWIETNGYGPTVYGPDGNVVRITIIARGNIYVADEIAMDDGSGALALVAVTDGESYHDLDENLEFTFTDTNENGVHDAGEPHSDPILHDDGNGVYDGPAEGSGNVYFGDPNVGPLGHVNAFMYAENSFDDWALGRDVDAGDVPQDFEVTGIMTAGDQLNIRRDFEYDLYVPGHYEGGELIPGHYEYYQAYNGHYYWSSNYESWVHSHYYGTHNRYWVSDQIVGGTWVPGHYQTIIRHAQMIVNYDPRVAEGMILPGVPGQQGRDNAEGWAITSWREVP